MRVAGRLAAEVLEMIGEHVKPGVTTEELDRICHDYIVNVQQAIPAPLNYKGFPKSICTSINHVVCHGIPNDKPLKEGDIVNIDITVIKDGYHGDTSKMFLVGKVPEWAEKLCRITQECLYKGIELVRPGTRLGDIGEVIQKHAEKHGYSVVREYCGHGIGAVFHEEPQVLHYGKPGTLDELGRHDLHHRADDQSGSRGNPPAGRWLDGHYQGSQALRAMGAHRTGHRRRLRNLHPAQRRHPAAPRPLSPSRGSRMPHTDPELFDRDSCRLSSRSRAARLRPSRKPSSSARSVLDQRFCSERDDIAA